jgi:hypothetical protein
VKGRTGRIARVPHRASEMIERPIAYSSIKILNQDLRDTPFARAALAAKKALLRKALEKEKPARV